MCCFYWFHLSSIVESIYLESTCFLTPVLKQDIHIGLNSSTFEKKPVKWVNMIDSHPWKSNWGSVNLTLGDMTTGILNSYLCLLLYLILVYYRNTKIKSIGRSQALLPTLLSLNVLRFNLLSNSTSYTF